LNQLFGFAAGVVTGEHAEQPQPPEARPRASAADDRAAVKIVARAIRVNMRIIIILQGSGYGAVE
jgi:hypothetical protein